MAAPGYAFGPPPVRLATCPAIVAVGFCSIAGNRKIGQIGQIATFINRINGFAIQSFFLCVLSGDLVGKVVTATPNALYLAILGHLAEQNVRGVSVPHIGAIMISFAESGCP